jgi:hypothetical protein
MKIIMKLLTIFILCSLVSLFPLTTESMAENIDPGITDNKYAFAENVGWINAEPQGNTYPGITVFLDTLEGYAWSENLGWVSLSCQNTDSCTTVQYGIVNDGNGNLSGYAWSENTGWINFSPTDGGVRIDTITGKFSGFAWGENIGWINFNDSTDNSFAIITTWGHDHDNDGLSSPEEIHIYGTAYNDEDSDDDGANDGAEAEYWLSYFGSWIRDFDLDGEANNLLDGDADNDGFLDGPEIATGTNPAVIISFPVSTVVDLYEGFNIVGFANPPADYKAYQLLEALGFENIVSIQRFSQSSGVFETAAFDQDQHMSGVNFSIKCGEGYIVVMRQLLLGFELGMTNP